MFERLQKSRLMFWSLELLIVASLIFVCTKISFVFSPIGTFVSTLFIPILIAGFLFYLFNPLIKLLGHLKISRNWAILIVFLIFFGGLALIVMTVIPNLVKQIAQLVVSLPDFASAMEKTAREWLKSPWLQNIDAEKYINQLNLSFSDILQSVMSSVTSSLGSVVGTVTSVAITAITIPVMLFYMLKDGHRLIPSIQKLMPNRYKAETTDLLSKMGETISTYIGGQLIECTFVGVFTFLGYLLIGMPYAFLLGFIAGICNIIPYVGPYIGIAPALIVALTVSPMQIILVIIVVVVVQQVDGNFIYPNVIGRTLSIHPLTIIILLLVAGNISGILGMILAIPFYAIVKTVVKYFWDIYQLRTREKELPAAESQKANKTD
ncbi:AI-2E family transporter [Loigolactobacillus backii]|uniref:AI-2E family transporter n=1 Tax=Loigolactobacillus backii TaxID=375175 RepID=A0A192H625_9LACO|nr:AI-2E family transporter [Loigolactobacillus backii]ANK63441.1 AI-2E family transporter [Loigolactobacillus backii]ANK70906.1 AI-2E family transporter [Loigolactobacillus backii]MDA5388114.1 AI-2E family transporter [Loigolactobacillus backii]MDA5390606.1 AI-2E family transporter [Loigolactobacillus backii]